MSFRDVAYKSPTAIAKALAEPSVQNMLEGWLADERLALEKCELKADIFRTQGVIQTLKTLLALPDELRDHKHNPKRN